MKSDETVVWQALEERNRQMNEKEATKPLSAKPRLWPTDMHTCGRRAMLRLMGVKPTNQPNTVSRNRFKQGNALEDDTLEALRAKYEPATPIETQLWLNYGRWSGRPDFVLGHGTGKVTIIEHKATGDKWFDYDESLPREEHLGQAWLYWWMYQKCYAIAPMVVIFYRAWSDWAEFYLDYNPDEDLIQVNGWVNGVAEFRNPSLKPNAKRIEMEQMVRSGELPPRLTDKKQGCTYGSGNYCKYYDHCWRQE